MYKCYVCVCVFMCVRVGGKLKMEQSVICEA